MKKLSVLAGCLFVLSAGPLGLAPAQAPAKAEAAAAVPAQTETPIIKLGEAAKDAGKPALEFAKAGFGSLKLDGLLQGWYQYTDGA